MSILSAILPSLRELRTPLAVGYLWILIAWLAWPAVPEGALKQAFADRIDEAATLAGGPAALILGAGLLAYAAGIALTTLSDGLLNGLNLLVSVFMLLLIGTTAWGLRALSIPIAIAYGGYIFVTTAKSARRLTHWRERLLRDSLSLLHGFTRTLVWLCRSDEFRRRERRRRYLAELVDRSVGNDKLAVSEMLKETPRLDLLKLWSFIYYSGQMPRVFVNHDGKLRTSRSIDVHIAFTRRSKADGWGEIRDSLTEVLTNLPHLRPLVYARFLPLGDLDRLLRRELDDLPIKMKTEHAEIYQTWDQLMAEGDFRRGIAVPAAALGPAVWCSVAGPSIVTSTKMSVDAALPLLLTISIGLAFFFGVQGGIRRDMAHAHLIACVRRNWLPLEDQRLKDLSGLHRTLSRQPEYLENIRLLFGFEQLT